jgi:methyl-accepting chemotaxis protein
MKSLMNKLKMKHKLLTLVCCSLAGILVIGFVSAKALKESLLSEKEAKTSNLVESAYGVIEHFHKLFKDGKMSEENAKSTALQAIKAMRYGDNDYFWINDMHPRMVMHPIKPELDGSDLSDKADPKGKKLFVTMVDVVKSKKAGFVNYLWPKPNFKDPVEKISYVKGFEPWGWVVGTGVYIDDVNTLFWNKVKVIGLITIITLGLLLLLSWWIVATITMQLGSEPNVIADISERIAEGDLTLNFSSNGVKSTGVYASMSRMAENLRKIIGEVKSSAETIASASQELSASSEQMSRSIAEQSNRSTQIATASEQMSQTVIDVAKNAVHIASTATDTAETAKQSGQIVSKSVQEVKAIAMSVSGSAKTISTLGEKSKQIGEIVGVIKDIADQTNLLALNAAIEAARAGEQGRGFAVVADEVRKLAERTAKATSEIAGMIRSIQAEVDGAVRSMDEATKQVGVGVDYSTKAGETLEGVVKRVGDLQSMVQQIATATEEMSSASEQVNGDINAIASSSNEVSVASNQISSSSSDLARLATTLQEVVAQFQVTGNGNGRSN